MLDKMFSLRTLMLPAFLMAILTAPAGAAPQ